MPNTKVEECMITNRNDSKSDEKDTWWMTDVIDFDDSSELAIACKLTKVVSIGA
jgi:hypothetical protein